MSRRPPTPAASRHPTSPKAEVPRVSTRSVATTFQALGLSELLVDTLATLGYEEPTPIQRETIPPLLSGRDLLGQAATGTGKTAAFAVPFLQRLSLQETGTPHPALLVLVPTRELAMQVADAMHRYGRALGIRVLPIYGGQAFDQQLRALRRGVHVVVATPGRALDHIRRRTLELDRVRGVVLDEADEMLDMGFAEDLEAILAAVPAERQTALFSATIPSRIATIAERHLRDPVTVRIAPEGVAPGEMPRVRQIAYIVQRAYKVPALGRILDLESPTLALVFCRMRTEVDSLTETLVGRGYSAESLHGGMSQEHRDRVMKRARAGAVDLLIATDVAARGLDIEHVSHVVNFDVPCSPGIYVHRIGRTGRAGREGVAITLAEPREHRQLRNIEQLIKQPLEMRTIPTVLEVRARRLDVTRAAIRDAIVAGELDSYRVAVEALAEEFDVMDVAMAAVKLAHEATVGEASADRVPEVETDVGGSGVLEPRSRSRAPFESRRSGDRTKPTGTPVRVYVGAGREANMRPADLVGAIANETGIDARAIGAIEIGDRFSLVELPETLVDSVIDALRNTRIKGKRLTVRRERERPSARPSARRDARRGSA